MRMYRDSEERDVRGTDVSTADVHRRTSQEGEPVGPRRGLHVRRPNSRVAGTEWAA